MPQASEELRAKWGGYDGVGDDKASTYLEQQGWFQIEGGLWTRPQNRPLESVTDDEWEALQFLIDEWDHALCPDPITYLKQKVADFARAARLAQQEDIRAENIKSGLRLVGAAVTASACLTCMVVSVRFDSLTFGMAGIAFAILLNGYNSRGKK